MRVIESPGLRLEPQVTVHAEEMFAVLSDPAIYEYENEPPPSVEWLRARFAKLESRRSADGQEQWLNWVIRLPTSGLIGYVQASVRANGRAAIAYELASAYWGRGLASQAVGAMIGELVEHYHVRTVSAVFKRENYRSMRLLERLGFTLASPTEHVERQVEPGEQLMELNASLIGMRLTVTNTFAVAELGTVAFVGLEPIPLALGSRHRVRVTRPDGESVEAVASVEAVRKDASEFPALLFASLAIGEVVPGSSICVLGEAT